MVMNSNNMTPLRQFARFIDRTVMCCHCGECARIVRLSCQVSKVSSRAQLLEGEGVCLDLRFHDVYRAE